ncbi:sugar transferase [Clostridium sediminicola]|uniref:sugar transferase n=1 Tax=Clostridium sediminicola TaxID=3114879 RepID=UPI0031F239BE
MKIYLIIKRIVDFIFALLLLIITLPIIVIASIAIKVESKGPILFKQKRPGKNSKIFTIIKFRTMIIEIEKSGKQLSDMQRITKVGYFLRKTSLDELPQLFNIIKGEMSFIGPRPLRISYLNFYSSEQNRRHEVTPGISGWAQVHGRNSISWKEKFKNDIWYVDHISLWVDIKIVLLTLKNVLTCKDINQSSNDTMEDFKGSN